MVETLLQATTRILRREGRESLTTNRIAEVAGVSVGSLYQYFPNKESLVDALRQRYEAQFLERMIRAFGSGASLPLREAVREFARFIIDIHRDPPMPGHTPQMGRLSALFQPGPDSHLGRGTGTGYSLPRRAFQPSQRAAVHHA